MVLASGTPAELAVPEQSRRGVVLAPDIMGLRPLFDDLCARLAAEQGWAVCAPEPFPNHPGAPVEERLELVRTLRDDEQIGDLLAAAEVLRTEVGVERVAVLGFCLGGMYALKSADNAVFDRVVSFYGMIRVPEQFRGPGHREPLASLRSPDVRPVLALVGGRDHFTPAADVDDLEATGATVVRYPEAEHGFVHDPDRPAHRAEDAADAWRRVVAFLNA
ncbi:MAG: dienelactone hydrolase-like enzyme [Acidimicrobiales bacterium]|nr:dienelactone hydrolase-like enzyme [Acidimicrobiales bacterium]